jgi:hypothetical protein
MEPKVFLLAECQSKTDGNSACSAPSHRSGWSPGMARRSISFRSSGRSAVAPLIFSRWICSHPAALAWAPWLLRSWASVTTQA